jgi:hypothetical protein
MRAIFAGQTCIPNQGARNTCQPSAASVLARLSKKSDGGDANWTWNRAVFGDYVVRRWNYNEIATILWCYSAEHLAVR